MTIKAQTDTAKVAFQIIADSGPQTREEAHIRHCQRIDQQLRSAIATAQRCRKSWPVDDTGIHGPRFLDEAIWHLTRAAEIVRAETVTMPKGTA